MSSPMLVMPLPAGPLHNTPGNSHHHLGGISPTSARMRIPAHHSPYLAQHPVHQPWQSPINQTSYNYAERSILQSPILPPSSSLYPAYQLIIPPLMGLANHGNSCFLNATLQILAHSPLLIQSILEVSCFVFFLLF